MRAVSDSALRERTADVELSVLDADSDRSTSDEEPLLHGDGSEGAHIVKGACCVICVCIFIACLILCSGNFVTFALQCVSRVDSLEIGSRQRVSAGHSAAQQESSFLVEIDDVLDIDALMALVDPPLPAAFHVCTTHTLFGSTVTAHLQTTTMVRRLKWNNVNPLHLNQEV